MGSGATSYTYVRYSTSTFPTNRAEGSLGFNSTSTTPEITGLDPGTRYYGSAWAWGEESSVGQFSDTYITFEFNTSNYPVVITNASTSVEETTATIWGFLESNGSADATCWFLWDTDNDYANNESQGVKANRSEFSKGLTTLTSGDLYYFNTKANNSAGWDNDGGELTFFTKPEDPDSITTTTINATNASFPVDKADMGSGATSYTYARYNTGSAPTTRAEGSFGFNSTSDIPKITGLSSCTHYYVSAWAWGEEGGIGQYSDTYITTDFWTACIPVVITNESTGVEETNATLRGYLQSNGSVDTYTYLATD